MSDNDQFQARAAFFAWPAQQASSPALSIVIPMYNEDAGAAALVQETTTAVNDLACEIIVVDDGSTDSTLAALTALKPSVPNLRVIAHGRNAGQSRAIRSGVIAARAPIVATLDGDGQNDPADIPFALETLRAQSAEVGLAMVAGQRLKRQDSAAKKWASQFANGLRRRILNDDAIDTGCGLKVFYREAFLRLPYFDHAHRYLPALMQREGYLVDFISVSHRPRLHGQSKYDNLGRLLVAVRDLLGVLWLKGRSRQPETIREV
ncbi:MAG: glycosyltransferase family 2 protein [Pseudomonadota bacterium]